jgi:circadian clock protein KaiB
MGGDVRGTDRNKAAEAMLDREAERTGPDAGVVNPTLSLFGAELDNRLPLDIKKRPAALSREIPRHAAFEPGSPVHRGQRTDFRWAMPISESVGAESVQRALPGKRASGRGPAQAASTGGSSPQHGRVSIWKATNMNRQAEDSRGYNLRLYVAGQTPKSIAAMCNLRNLCEKYLSGRYSLDVIDLMADPNLAQRDEIIAVPTLVRCLPQPSKRVVGDLSNSESVLTRLGIDVSAKV